MSPIRMLAGLGNPGPRYADTRHNVGARFARSIALRFGITLGMDRRFKAEIGRGNVLGMDLRIVVPATFMNLSGEAVGAVAQFYRIAPPEILVAYDEMAFEPGVVRLRSDGGDNGHNGLASVIAGLGNERGFHRLRIGVGHPGNRDLVTAYLTSVRMPEDERRSIDEACELPDDVLRPLFAGDIAKAMNRLHAPRNSDQEEG